MYWFGVVYAERRESPEEYIETFPNGKIWIADFQRGKERLMEHLSVFVYQYSVAESAINNSLSISIVDF
jgi:hypothetical protein